MAELGLILWANFKVDKQISVPTTYDSDECPARATSDT